ncbi:MAG: protein-glutamate O-methyltransferase CheR [Nitrospirota bacterium]|nr:protein-glutamate O-methyltransferase CheR [Nitrospirota bacterium]MDH5585860.1 protein-glutamate O-methyltransferase CheR [Nitrospirota bacterium]MDH5773699.1 protein-glutamate O-methyltransferase CheR [Nitrospirota bacterium]
MEKEVLNTEDLGYVRKLVRTRSAIVLEPEKAYLVHSRLEPLAKNEGLASLAELVKKLRSGPYGALHKKVVEAMTTNETSFFRDLTPFQVLREHLLPEIIARKGGSKRLTMWCGASSSGQEPYSVMFTIYEHFPEIKDWVLQYTATDISEEMLAKCREGKYSQLEVNRGLPAALLSKYFVKKGMGWQVNEDLRRRIDFKPMNLAGPWLPFPTMDIVFLRNVMIYFDTDTKKQILANIRKILDPNGYLFLGGSETTMNVDDHYERVAISGTSCYRVKKG